MGKKSRTKKERKEMGFSGKEIKQLKKKAQPALFEAADGHSQAYNPLKNLIQGKVYKDEAGFNVLNYTVQKYTAYMMAAKEKSENKEKENN